MDEQAWPRAFRRGVSPVAFYSVSLVARLVLLDTFRSTCSFWGLETLFSTALYSRARTELSSLDAWLPLAGRRDSSVDSPPVTDNQSTCRGLEIPQLPISRITGQVERDAS
jgi:hypothetical protein